MSIELSYLSKNFSKTYKKQLEMAEVISFSGNFLENVNVRYYREVSRNHLLKVIKQQKEQVNDSPTSNYNKNLEEE